MSGTIRCVARPGLVEEAFDPGDEGFTSMVQKRYDRGSIRLKINKEGSGEGAADSSLGK